MNYEMRRTDRKTTEKEAVEILTKCSYGILSTISDSGYPYGVPVNYIYDNGCIYFHCAANVGHKLKNIETNPNVCFTVVGKETVIPNMFTTSYESVVIFGKAEKISGAEKQTALEHIIEKYSFAFKEAGLKYISEAFDTTDIAKITPEQITGKSNRKQ
ncbi:MAG: pyridoxamine 5'-phosphate oxidase family protein [Candidatus Metalachnospira sp.]|nr:pyridoxamine 5'-phosphate oxidase family protein [Candidatus Metalachnospira sp.]